MKSVVSLFLAADKAVDAFVEALHALAFTLKYDRKTINEAGELFKSELPKGYQLDTVTLSLYLARAGFTREASQWFLNGMKLVTPSAVCQALDKSYGNSDKKRGGGPKPKDPVVKAADYVAKLGLSKVQLKELAKLIAAM